MPGTLFVVATPIGNLEDVSARALRVLREAAVIAAEDTRRTAHLLARYAITTPTTSLHEHNEGQKLHSLIDRLTRGDSVALVSDAGTPTVSDPGQQLIRAAVDAGIRIEPIPGPSAVLSALAVSGFSSDSFTFLGFPPVRSKDRKQWLERLRHAEGTVVFFEAPHRILETLDEVHQVAGDVPTCVGRELTKAHEELVRGPITAVRSAIGVPIGEFTVVLDLSHKGETGTSSEIPEAKTLLDMFGEMTEHEGFSRRDAVAELARRYDKPVNDVYRAIEDAKKFVL